MAKVFKKDERIVTRDVAGETILVPIRGKLAELQRIFSLNPVAEYIWQELDGKRSVEEIRDDVLANFAVEKEQADREIDQFLKELLEAGLIKERG